MQKAIYAGSFDPITNGHLWLIKEALTMFDELIIVIASNADKKYMFSTIEREKIIAKLTKQDSNIKIVHLNDYLLVDYANEINVKYLVRGLRNQTDFEYEKRMLNVNNNIDNTIKTIFLIPPSEYTDISSNLVKGLVKSNNFEKIVTKYVPSIVLEQLIIKKQGK
jgi:pantetheine-phosphate adenylyltransferase